MPVIRLRFTCEIPDFGRATLKEAHQLHFLQPHQSEIPDFGRATLKEAWRAEILGDVHREIPDFGRATLKVDIVQHAQVGPVVRFPTSVGLC